MVFEKGPLKEKKTHKVIHQRETNFSLDNLIRNPLGLGVTLVRTLQAGNFSYLLERGVGEKKPNTKIISTGKLFSRLSL